MSVRLPCSLWPVAALAGLAAGFTLAADRPNDPLLQRRGEWRAQVLRETKALREKHAADLLQLERELVLSGDYTGASRVRTERWQVLPEVPRSERTVPAPAGEPVPDAPVELKPQAAAVSGGVVLDVESGALTGWKAVGAAVRWLLPAGLEAGGYEVELTWSSPSDGGGEVLLREDTHSLRRTVKPTAGTNHYQTAVIGTLRLVSRSRMLEISAAAVKGPEMFRLKSVRLIPVAGRK
jgi:hypothetical protein